MSVLFCNSPSLCELERQMQQPPGYRPRGHGVYLFNEDEWKGLGNYTTVVDCVISRMQMERLRARIDRIFESTEKEMIFASMRHRKDYHFLMKGKRGKCMSGSPNYAAAVFLLSADEALWDRVHKHVSDTGIYFDRIRLGSVSLPQYILFHAAKDVYNGTRHIRLSELEDRELIEDSILRLIVNAFVIEKYGVRIAEEEWDEN